MSIMKVDSRCTLMGMDLIEMAMNLLHEAGLEHEPTETVRDEERVQQIRTTVPPQSFQVQTAEGTTVQVTTRVKRKMVISSWSDGRLFIQCAGIDADLVKVVRALVNAQIAEVNTPARKRAREVVKPELTPSPLTLAKSRESSTSSSTSTADQTQLAMMHRTFTRLQTTTDLIAAAGLHPLAPGGKRIEILITTVEPIVAEGVAHKMPVITAKMAVHDASQIDPQLILAAAEKEICLKIVSAYETAAKQVGTGHWQAFVDFGLHLRERHASDQFKLVYGDGSLEVGQAVWQKATAAEEDLPTATTIPFIELSLVMTVAGGGGAGTERSRSSRGARSPRREDEKDEHQAVPAGTKRIAPIFKITSTKKPNTQRSPSGKDGDSVKGGDDSVKGGDDSVKDGDSVKGGDHRRQLRAAAAGRATKPGTKGAGAGGAGQSGAGGRGVEDGSRALNQQQLVLHVNDPLLAMEMLDLERDWKERLSNLEPDERIESLGPRMMQLFVQSMPERFLTHRDEVEDQATKEQLGQCATRFEDPTTRFVLLQLDQAPLDYEAAVLAVFPLSRKHGEMDGTLFASWKVHLGTGSHATALKDLLTATNWALLKDTDSMDSEHPLVEVSLSRPRKIRTRW